MVQWTANDVFSRTRWLYSSDSNATMTSRSVAFGVYYVQYYGLLLVSKQYTLAVSQVGAVDTSVATVSLPISPSHPT